MSLATRFKEWRRATGRFLSAEGLYSQKMKWYQWLVEISIGLDAFKVGWAAVVNVDCFSSDSHVHPRRRKNRH